MAGKSRFQTMSNSSKLMILIVVFVVAFSIAYSVLSQNKNKEEQPTATYNQSIIAAELFIRSSPTYKFDGSFLDFVNSSECGKSCWVFRFKFFHTLEGYGDRTGRNATSKLGVYEVDIRIEGGEIVSAVIGGVWDELNQRQIYTS